MSQNILSFTHEALLNLLPRRQRTAHKGLYGHVLVIGGDYGMAGAVRLAAEAAMRVGAGLVTVATRQEHVSIVTGVRPELLCYGVKQARALKTLLVRANVIVIGPGLGQSRWAQQLLAAVLNTDLPIIMDADALNLLATKSIKSIYRDNWILTPHPGEAARLLMTDIAKLQADRLTAAKNIQLRYGGICILKGAGTVIKDATNIPSICDKGNPGMASGGMGDVLSGVIAGLLTQGLPLITAAQLGVYLHAQAADLAAVAGERGMLALDLMPYLRQLVNPSC